MNSAPQNGGAPMTASKQTDSFAPHPYAPSGPPQYTMDATGPDFNDLFCVQKEKQQQQVSIEVQK